LSHNFFQREAVSMEAWHHVALVTRFHSVIAVDRNTRRVFCDIKCLCLLKRLYIEPWIERKTRDDLWDLKCRIFRSLRRMGTRIYLVNCHRGVVTTLSHVHSDNLYRLPRTAP